ncbi:unnamed protein product [Caenorhabditis angaria]|uniref:Uncharacterized protein n=1 Tax=Caenorhabditis angaria TaxID=860376 RepID=A0A9P1MVH3_9PELO|nr:unnamed protein product [Caenorhabditis angaria]
MAMLAARGVSLGLGKINLSDLNQLPQDRLLAAQLKKEEKIKKPKIIIKKKADAKTVWAACRAVIFGCIIIVVGLSMAVLGYFDIHFSERVRLDSNGSQVITHDKFIQYQLKSMQYLGPILMGIGSFILIIACVVTLESRDKHAQIITEESILQKRRKRAASAAAAEQNTTFVDDDEKETFVASGNCAVTTFREEEEQDSERRKFVALDANRLAPLADVDSLTDISITNRSRIQSDETPCLE